MRKLAMIAALSPLSAFAAAPTVEATTTEIATYAAPVAAIGLAVLTIVLAVKGVKWFRKAL